MNITPTSSSNAEDLIRDVARYLNAIQEAIEEKNFEKIAAANALSESLGARLQSFSAERVEGYAEHFSILHEHLESLEIQMQTLRTELKRTIKAADKNRQAAHAYTKTPEA